MLRAVASAGNDTRVECTAWLVDDTIEPDGAEMAATGRA